MALIIEMVVYFRFDLRLVWVVIWGCQLVWIILRYWFRVFEL